MLIWATDGMLNTAKGGSMTKCLNGFERETSDSGPRDFVENAQIYDGIT